MKFSVIYSLDVPNDISVKSAAPKNRKLWEMTESGESEYSYLADESENMANWKPGKHRKFCALLTRKQFESFLQDVCLYPEDCETMGSLGAPGFGWGIAPAISFNNEDPYCERGILNAYVTPIPSCLDLDDESPSFQIDERR